MRPDSINFAANFRFGTAFPPFPTNYPQRVGQRELWRRVKSSDLMRGFLGLIVLLCVTRYLIEMWNAFAQVHQGHSVRMNRSLYSDLLVISRQLFSIQNWLLLVDNLLSCNQSRCLFNKKRWERGGGRREIS